MSNDKELEDEIRENMLGPKKATGDSGSIEQHSLQDQIAARKFLASQNAAQSKGLGGIKLVKLSPDGTT